MPSQPLDGDWNFSPVFDLIESDTQDVSSPALRPEKSHSMLLPDGGGIGLGSFGKLYESLGMVLDVAAPPLPSLDESESSTSDDALLPSPVLEVIQDTPKAVHRQLVQSASELSITPLPTTPVPTTPLPTGTTKKQRRKARRLAEKALQEDEPQAILEALAGVSGKEESKVTPDTPSRPSRAQSNVGAKIRPATPVPALDATQLSLTPSLAPRPVLSKRSQYLSTPVTLQPQPPTQLMSVPFQDGTITLDTPKQPAAFQYSLAPQYISQLQPSQVANASPGLVPRTVRPVTLPKNSVSVPVPMSMPVTSSPAPPMVGTPTGRPAPVLRSQVDRHFHLFERLLVNFPEERRWLISPRQLINENTKAEGIHVFVDASNIMIGFKEILRNHHVRQSYDLSFDSLALLMERRRPVAKRVLVGSHREANPLPATQRLIETCKAVGYECNIQEQVFITREESQKKKFFNDVSRFGWQKAQQMRSGSGSDSETGTIAAQKTPTPQRWLEQGVDELLHLKMCQSILDTELPGTMILATGDGAEAEMSDGFLAHVERALKRGWRVELITWKQQTNGGYKRRAFREKWGDQFTIIELDEFLEDLIDTP